MDEGTVVQSILSAVTRHAQALSISSVLRYLFYRADVMTLYDGCAVSCC